MENFHIKNRNKFLDLEHKNNGDFEVESIFKRDKQEAIYLVVNSMVNYDKFSELKDHRKMFVAHHIKEYGLKVEKGTPLHDYILERNKILKERRQNEKNEERMEKKLNIKR